MGTRVRDPWAPTRHPRWAHRPPRARRAGFVVGPTTLAPPMKQLAHSLVTDTDAAPERWMLFVHGILGTRSNWRGLARRFVRRRPEWGAVLVDLRQHGDSQGFAGPHTVAAAARDLAALSPAIPGSLRGVVGHSFGGKVALAYARERGSELSDVFLVDSMPGPRPEARNSGDTLALLEVLERLPFPFVDRDAFVDALAEAGITRGIGQWLAMNLERHADGGLHLRTDLASIRELLADYFAIDLWPAFEHPAEGVRTTAIVGGQSKAFSPADLERSRRASLANPLVRTEVIEHAGHWVHVDAPVELM